MLDLKMKKTKQKPDCTVILKTESINEPYIRYFTGIKTDFAMLVLFPRKKPLFFRSPLEKPPRSTKFDTKEFSIDEIKRFFKKIKPRRIGYDKQHLSVGALQFLKGIIKKTVFVDVSNELTAQFAIKTPQHIAFLKKAAALTQNIIDGLLNVLPKLRYEDEALTFLRVQALKQGLELSFDPMVASGKHAGNPHYQPKPKTPLQKGFCIIDFGVKYNGFCADISRTIYLGTPTKKEKDAYQRVLKYIIKLESHLKVDSKQVKNPWEIPHALGHGIGINVHEIPLVGKDTLKENMCIAVEPGMYTKQFGIRIEDNYVVKKMGLQRISVGNRTLKILKKD